MNLPLDNPLTTSPTGTLLEFLSKPLPVDPQLVNQEYFKMVYRESDLMQRNRARACKAGSATKTDALQECIIEIVQQRPTINANQLLYALRGGAGHGVVESVNEDIIEFYHRDKIKSAKVSGLKDRLTRAKKTLART